MRKDGSGRTDFQCETLLSGAGVSGVWGNNESGMERELHVRTRGRCASQVGVPGLWSKRVLRSNLVRSLLGLGREQRPAREGPAVS